MQTHTPNQIIIQKFLTLQVYYSVRNLAAIDQIPFLHNAFLICQRRLESWLELKAFLDFFSKKIISKINVLHQRIKNLKRKQGESP